MYPIMIVLTASLMAGLSTGLGALPALLGEFSEEIMDLLLGFSAGVMLAATAFSLLVPAMEISNPITAALGLLLGTAVLHILDRMIPHLHPVAGPEGPPSKLAKVWLFIIAMTLHNFPEGVAVGVSFGMGDVATGLVVATAIGLQNAPEGLAVALPLIRERYSRWRAVGYATLTGLVEPLGALLGFFIVSLAHALLPWGLTFAAGAMLFIVVDEMVPESHEKGFGRKATFGLIIGFTLMMVLDNLLK